MSGVTCHICGEPMTTMDMEQTHKGVWQVSPCGECKSIAKENYLELSALDIEEEDLYETPYYPV